MSCKTCIHCVTEMREMEHGPDQEFCKCALHGGAELHVYDICEHYYDRKKVADSLVESQKTYPVNDVVSHPSHYTEGRKYEPKDVIRDWGLNFNLGSAVKYISRAGRKDDIIQDLKKAKQFLDFEIDYLEGKR